MGVWGVEPFDNDDAADWAAEFDGADGSTGLHALRRALEVANTIDYLEAPDGAVAVAAAQVVAWLRHPDTIHDTPYNESVNDWLRSNAPRADRDLVDAARQSLARVRAPDSELADLWSEAEDPGWAPVLDRIASQLESEN